MCSKILSCPLCCQPNFPTIDSLKISLVKVVNRPLICPICNEILMGLDKLTIHLFSHSITSDEKFFDEKSLNYTNITTIKVCDNDKLIKKHIKQGKNHNNNNNIMPPLVPTTNVSQFKIETQQSPSVTIATNTIVPSASATTTTTTTTNIYQNILNQQQYLPKCDICGFNFKTNDLLSLHMCLVHTKKSINEQNSAQSKYQCHLCSKYFKMKGSLKVHLRVVHLGFQTRKHLINNKNINSNNNNISNKVSICDKNKMIKNENEEQQVLPVESSSSPTLILVNKPKLENLEETKMGNNNNDELIFEQKNSIRNHYNVNTGNDLQETEIYLFDNYNEKSPKDGNTLQKNWECDVCTKTFTTKYFLKKHKRLHTGTENGEMPYSCAICSKTFTFQQSYHKHLLYHSDEKPHMCTTCGRSFKELSTLHNHERIHSGEKPFKCESCGKCFRQRVSYLVHKRIHTGAMPYKCTACEKSFRYKVSQRTHKCSAQPPGAVIRQTGDLLQKLLQNATVFQSTSNTDSVSPKSAGHNEDPITQSIDEIIKESCNRMGIDDSSFSAEIEDICKINSTATSPYNEEIPSPSEKMQNLCLYSSPTNIPKHNLETINEDSLKQLLYGSENNF